MLFKKRNNCTFIVFDHEKHASSLYISRNGNFYSLVLIDSTPSESTFHLLETLSNYFGKENVWVYCNRLTLQVDYYSCSIFAFFSAIFFARDGIAYLDYLASKEIVKDDGIFFISLNALPKQLIELYQKPSGQQKITFFSDVPHSNPKALVEKYKIFCQLGNVLKKVAL